jgi:hypothetical protein
MARLIPFLLLIPTVSWAAPEVCQTEQELLAGVAAGFLLTQQASAGMCDGRLADAPAEKIGPMGALVLEIQKKFRAEFLELAKARRAYYQRGHGNSWKEALGNANGEAAWRIINELEMGEAECERLLTELEIRLNSPWDYIKARLDSTAKGKRGAVKLCK